MSTFEICRDDRCVRLEVHAAHLLTTPEEAPVRPSRGRRPVWQHPAPRALDHAIAKATSLIYPRHLDAIVQYVHADYGPCTSRAILRRLGRLVERGQILRIDLGRQLYAYLRPGSKLVGDVGLMREQILAHLGT
jgi:hypothetical protein